MRAAIGRSNNNNDDNSQSSDDDDYNKLGETLVRATKFLGTIVKGKNSDDNYDPNHDIDRYLSRSISGEDGANFGERKKSNDDKQEDNIINERFNGANEGNLYQGLRSVRHTNSDGMGMGNVGLDEDELSFSSDDGSQMSMPRIDEKRYGMSLIDEAAEGEYSSGSDDDTDEEGARIFSTIAENSMEEEDDDNGSNQKPPLGFVPARLEMMSGHRQASDISMHSQSKKLHRQSSDISTQGTTSEAVDCNNTSETWASTTAPSQSSAGNSTPRLLRAFGLQRDETTRSNERPQNRRSSVQSTATEDSGEDNSKLQRRWFGGRSFSGLINTSKSDLKSDVTKVEEDDCSVTADNANMNGKNNSLWDSATNILDTSQSSLHSSYTELHAKNRSNFTKRHVNAAAMHTQSFRILQKRMKEKGAVTANSIVHLLQEAAEEHAVENYVGEEDQSSNASIDLHQLEEESVKKDTWYTRSTASFNESIVANKAFRRASSKGSKEEQLQQNNEARQRRLEEDPMFGCGSKSTKSKAVNKSDDSYNSRPYITIPSRESSKAEILYDVMRKTADHGETSLITVHGQKFVGKTRLIRKVIDTGQIQGLGYTVLKSKRTSNDVLTSFHCFGEIMSAALRACDAVTLRSDESFDSSGPDRGLEGEDEETDELIVRRLIQRKILNKNDQLMIGRIIPAVMNNQLLSLLKGRSPAALTKDIVASLFKILIPLQPVMLVFEAEGNDCDIDPSSWNLVEELLLSAGEHCPQMLMIAVSRHSLAESIPSSVKDKHVDVHIGRMNKNDTECYIRALFCDPNCIDRNTEVDAPVVDGIYDRANGCPLFTERLVLWAERNNIIELDERRNAVALNLPSADCNDSKNEVALLLERLPSNLNEEILVSHHLFFSHATLVYVCLSHYSLTLKSNSQLISFVQEVINNLPDHLLDALKLSACIGITFDIDRYKALKEEGFYASLQEIISSVGIFDELDDHCYRWKHVAVYEAVQSIIIRNERVEIQGRIADSVRDLPSKNDCAQFARHSVMAERWDDAFDRYMDAGDAAEERLDFLGAVGLYQQAKICLTKSRTKPTLRRKLSPYAALGWCLRELVRYDDAEMELEYCLKQTMAVPERKRNNQFEEIEVDVITTLATLKQAQSKYVEAMQMYEHALPKCRANTETHSLVWLAHHVAQCAEIHRKSGDLEQAKTLHTEALGYRETAVEENSCTVLELAISYTQLGCTLSGLGEYARAYGLHKKALTARVEHLDFYHSLVSESLNYCADALQTLGKGRKGIPLGMHAVAIRHFVFGPYHPAYAHALSVLASCYHSVGRSFDALSLLEECLEICEKAFTANHANLIPNLMLYASVLKVCGDASKSKEVYTRALKIHKLNFKEGQNAHQLEKLENALEELYSNSQPQIKPSLELPIPSFEPDSSKTHLIVCCDIGSRASDAYMLNVAASLEEMGSLKLVSVIAVSPPQVVRANIARGALDSLLLSTVPVAYSGVVSTPSSRGSGANTATYNDEYGKPSAYVNKTGVELITRALLQAPSKSLVIMCTACLGDVSEVIDTHRDLFSDKVKQVVIMGNIKPVRRKCFIEPEEESGHEREVAFTKNVYQSCQELEIPTITLSKSISRGFPFSSALVDDLTLSNHMVSTKIQKSEEMHVNGIWELIKQLKQEARSYRTPKTLDIKSFYKYSLGGKHPNAGQHSIWPMVKSINLELVLGLLSCIPAYQDTHFRWDTHEVNGIEHKYSRHGAGIIKPDALSNEIHMLIGFSLRTSLLNTSC